MTDPHRGQPVTRVGPPPSESRLAVVMVHGRNASPENILDLVPRLGRAGITYLAPAAANRTWYPLSFLAEIALNEPCLTSALGVIGRLIEDIVAGGCPRSRIVLAGFSQGACLTAEFVCRNPARYGGVLVFSGGLIGPPGTVWNAAGTFDGAPIFLGCSDIDAHVPRSRVDESARVFSRMGAEVTERIYPGMGHLVNDDEVRFAQTILDQLLA